MASSLDSFTTESHLTNCPISLSASAAAAVVADAGPDAWTTSSLSSSTDTNRVQASKHAGTDGSGANLATMSLLYSASAYT